MIIGPRRRWSIYPVPTDRHLMTHRALYKRMFSSKALVDAVRADCFDEWFSSL
ncbi:MAG: hypothetical protein H6656_18345 [Ardenticatenaceae bacterium]|nr:hypothetical protein [Ardenticatenaceae bacterium]